MQGLTELVLKEQKEEEKGTQFPTAQVLVACK